MNKALVAIVGQPNVGKSTFFNRIIEKREAIVDDFAGVTRDRKYAEAEWCGTEFTLVDTGGYFPGVEDKIGKAILQQVDISIDEADVVIYMVDGRAGLTPMDEDIIFTETDLKNLIYSKGAVYAGFTTLLKEAGMDFSMVEQIIISGGFGRYLNIEKAVSIGLLPDIERDRFSYVGNSSIVGAYMALLSTEYRKEAREICSSLTYVDFSNNPNYMEQFTSALFLPHTNLEAFPSVRN